MVEAACSRCLGPTFEAIDRITRETERRCRHDCTLWPGGLRNAVRDLRERIKRLEDR